jgi:hypothetical protein
LCDASPHPHPESRACSTQPRRATKAPKRNDAINFRDITPARGKVQSLLTGLCQLGVVRQIASNNKGNDKMTQPVAEIVTFSLVENVTPADFTATSRQSEKFVRTQPGFVCRQLSQGKDGRWTDYVLWSDMAAAQAAAKLFPAQDFAAALMAAIATDIVHMRHETVLWDMTAT